MLRRTIVLFGGMLLLLTLWQCANPISPTGGPKDEQPPQIDSTRSTPNMQTNFRPEAIELTFDEWVKLEQANQQVVISPPLQGYRVSLKGKTVTVDLGDEDTLRSNVTYVIQFGEAVKDLTESNPAEDLRFVFSTGPYIDSLEISGQVVDAYTAEPVPQALVMLYDNLADSVFRTIKPFYFGRTTEEGQFRISNLRPGQYKMTALEDADANYRFNQVAERVAFVGEPVTISPDTNLNIQLRLFREELPLQVQEVDSSRWGLIKMTFNRPPTEELNLLASEQYLRSNLLDSIILWHQTPSRWPLIITADTLLRDTLTVPAAPASRAASQEAIGTFNIRGESPLKHAPAKPLRIGFTRPLTAVDTSLMSLLQDTLPERLPFRWEIDSIDQRILTVRRGLQESTNYRLVMEPGAVTDYWGIASTDSLRRSWTTVDQKSFGNLLIRYANADTSMQYHIRLLVKGQEPVATFDYAGERSYSNEVKSLPPGDYQLEIIQDLNRNGRWDSGKYDAKRQPEPVFIKTLETLRANWDLEVDVDLSTLFEG